MVNLKTYLFNTNFYNEDIDANNLISKQRKIMELCEGNIIITSRKSKYNYNDRLMFSKNHGLSLCYGLYIEDCKGKIKVDKHFPKAKALFIATMWSEQDIYVVAENGYYYKGSIFNQFLKDENEDNYKDLYDLDKIFLIYLPGDERKNILLDNFYITYCQEEDVTIVSYGMLEPQNIMSYTEGYTYAFSDQKTDTPVLNMCNEGVAIGDQFDLMALEANVEHTNKYYFINKYIEMFI